MISFDYEEKLNKVLEEYSSLGIAEQVDYKKFYLYSLITHSTAIEGSTITELENQVLFDEGISIKGKNMREQLMNLDLKNAYERSMKMAESHLNYSIDMLKELAALVMKNTGAEYNTIFGNFDASKGDLRLVGVTAGVGGRSYMDFRKVPDRLQKLCDKINECRDKLLNNGSIIEKYNVSFDSHLDLVTIHPWVDGNGRTSRMVMNQLQYEMGLIPVKILKEDRLEYIEALEASREEDSYEPFRSFMYEEHIRNLENELAEYKKSQKNDLIKVKNDLINQKNDPIKVENDPINLKKSAQKVLDAIKADGSLSYQEYAKILDVSEATVKRNISLLKSDGFIVREGSNKKGHWIVL